MLEEAKAIYLTSKKTPKFGSPNLGQPFSWQCTAGPGTEPLNQEAGDISSFYAGNGGSKQSNNKYDQITACANK